MNRSVQDPLLFSINNLLPSEIILLIKDYIPISILVFLNKTNYDLYHSLYLKKNVVNYEKYIRYMIRRDNSFVFETIMKEKYKKWLLIKDYAYKNLVFKNYLYFIIHYCIDNDSNNCRTIISNFLKELGLCKNQHKKNIVKHIRWKS
jgi:hypothetical protein